jgi:hypothetical protein
MPAANGRENAAPKVIARRRSFRSFALRNGSLVRIRERANMSERAKALRSAGL